MLVLPVLLAVSVWTVTGSAIPGKYFRPDYTYDKDAGGWLKFYPIPLTNTEATDRCIQDGAILASPIDDGLSNTLTSIMAAHGITHAPITTGISDHYRLAGQFHSIEGVPLEDMCLTWPTEPIVDCPADVHNCISLYANGSANAVCCSERHAFVCYRKNGVSELNKCGSVHLGYKHSNKTGSCYSPSVEKLSWAEAHKSCAKDGAHMAVINSDVEAKVLLELRDLVYTGTDKSLFLGATAWVHHQEWITVQGETLKEAGYSKWAEGEPNNILEKERCLSIMSTAKIADFDKGILNDVPCSATAFFICEMEGNTATVK